ncbi:very short patch repair endonuclease [Actinomadura sp. NAK00032]|uniref:very short patch repair endonuclease n=1 Tax=Actinomadura sp. NAK00032 TaxID=2742128 RepID=UPI0034A3AA4B
MCEVHNGTRAENLTEAWKAAIERKLVGTGEADAPRVDSWASSPAVRSVMRGNRGKDTRPELALRSAVHRLGLRYRVGSRPIPGVRRTADMVFTRAKVAVFLDGCFWHGCPEHHRPAKRNGEFWTSKIEGNRRRDRETNEILADTGWLAVRVWEHEDPQEAAQRVADVVRQRAANPTLPLAPGTATGEGRDGEIA